MYFLPFPCMFLSFFLLFSHSLRNDDFYYFYSSYRAKLTAYNQLYTKIYFTQYLFILFQCLYYLLFFCINAFTTFSLQLIVCVCSLTSLLGFLLACLRYGRVCVFCGSFCNMHLFQRFVPKVSCQRFWVEISFGSWVFV